MYLFHRFGLPIILLVCSYTALRAQVFMQPFENAANMAMGGASVAFDAPVNGITNPAQLGNAPKMGIMAWSALPYGVAGWQSHGFQAMTRLGKASGVNIGALHSGIEGYAEQRFQADYGRKLSEKISIGGSFLAMRVSADEYGNAMGYTVALGITAAPIPKVTLGAVVQNPFAQKVAGFTMANLIRLGARWQPSKVFQLAAEVNKDLERPVQMRIGMEYRPVQMVYLRTGMRTYPSRTDFGAGFEFKKGPRLDFGAEWHPTLGITPAAMVSWIIH